LDVGSFTELFQIRTASSIMARLIALKANKLLLRGWLLFFVPVVLVVVIFVVVVLVTVS
jgi:hypothetical protein